MSRGMDSANIAASVSETVRPVWFVELEYDSGTSRAHTALGTLTFGGNDYLGVGSFAGIESIYEDSELQATGVRLSLSGVDPAIVATALGENYQGRGAKIYLGFLDADHQLVADPQVMYVGRMDKQSISLSSSGSVSISLENRLIDWDRPRLSRYNNETQQAKYPGDRGLEHAEQAASKPISWGQERV